MEIYYEKKEWLDKNILLLSKLKKYEKSELSVKNLGETINIIDLECKKISENI